MNVVHNGVPSSAVEKLLVDGAADALRDATGDLALDQGGVEGAPDVVADDEPLDVRWPVPRSIETTAACSP